MGGRAAERGGRRGKGGALHVPKLSLLFNTSLVHYCSPLKPKSTFLFWLHKCGAHRISNVLLGLDNQFSM